MAYKTQTLDLGRSPPPRLKPYPRDLLFPPCQTGEVPVEHFRLPDVSKFVSHITVGLQKTARRGP